MFERRERAIMHKAPAIGGLLPVLSVLIFSGIYVAQLISVKIANRAVHANSMPFFKKYFICSFRRRYCMRKWGIPELFIRSDIITQIEANGPVTDISFVVFFIIVDIDKPVLVSSFNEYFFKMITDSCLQSKIKRPIIT